MRDERLGTVFSRIKKTVQFSVCFGAGFAFALLCLSGGTAFANNVDNAYRHLRVFGQVLSYVQQNYVDEIDEQTLVHNAISGLLSELDPYTTFMRPGEYRKLQEDTAGEFGGIGVELTIDQQVILIEAVVDGGPAQISGIQAGDRIVGIGGVPIEDPLLANVVELLRGVPGTKVQLQILRDTWTKERSIELIRRHVRVDSISHQAVGSEAGAGIVYVRVKSFQERTAHDLSQVLSLYQKEARAHGGLKGIILDLRDNPGGLFDQGVMVADLFLSEGEIVRTIGRNPRNVEQQNAHPAGSITDVPLALLINGGTASASEIVAGALQDHGRAVLIGRNSYGKGSVQTLFGLDDGAGLKLTVARYYTPKGRSIQEETIYPDILVPEGPGTAGSAEGLLADPDISKALETIIKFGSASKNIASGTSDPSRKAPRKQKP